MNYGLLSEVDWAWFAGIMDGEGSFWLTMKDNHFYAGMSVSNTYLPAMFYLQAHFGGNDYDTTDKVNLNRKPTTKLSWRSWEMIQIIPRILPYLRIKRRQAAIVLEYLTRFAPGARGHKTLYIEEFNYLKAAFDECRALNKRGR